MYLAAMRSTAWVHREGEPMDGCSQRQYRKIQTKKKKEQNIKKARTKEISYAMTTRISVWPGH